MDVNNLGNLVGKEHETEVKQLIDQNENLMQKVSLKNPKVTLILSIFLGMLAIDRLYQSGIRLFLYKIAILVLTFGVWWLVDIGYSIKFTQERNYNTIKKMCRS